MAKRRLAETVEGARSVNDRISVRSFTAPCGVCFTQEANVGRCARLAIGPPTRVLI
ncbi:MAG: hypothetical protein FD139_1547 [Methylocystaceae bacterium]|jgi:hypothetical protein|nr:MAG: hypothetical protein FD148_1181 [Methylocystaceae bacterium]KAF0213843.1 MAG: hypothetical protein FD172_270 [Methylocystaceae bacterium]TXT45608.1 MAG: hypothetical protein FD139_1547 [Methylocystaceae bacterium]